MIEEPVRLGRQTYVSIALVALGIGAYALFANRVEEKIEGVESHVAEVSSAVLEVKDAQTDLKYELQNARRDITETTQNVWTRYQMELWALKFQKENPGIIVPGVD